MPPSNTNAPGGAMDGDDVTDGSTADAGTTNENTADAGADDAVELLARSAAERSLAAPVVVDGALVGVVVVNDSANAEIGRAHV